MPQRRYAWSAWNYLIDSSSQNSSSQKELETVCLTYNMNILQAIPTAEFGDVLVTLNPPQPPAPELTQGTYQYYHPLCNSQAVRAQDKLQRIQGQGGVWYAGAWTDYGFHEDGFASGMRIGLQLGGDVSWEPQNAKFSRGMRPVLGWRDYLVRLIISILQMCIVSYAFVFGGSKSRTDTGRRDSHGNGNGFANGKAKVI